MLIGQLGWEKVDLISLLNIWRLFCRTLHNFYSSIEELNSTVFPKSLPDTGSSICDSLLD